MWGWGCWLSLLAGVVHTVTRVVVGGLVVLVVGLLFEICIVDASIFFLGFVCKFLRAHGGCLGTRSR